MLFFVNIPEKGCISGKAIPSLATHMGRLGASKGPFPDSGALAVRIGDAWSVSDSCCSQEFCPLERTTYGSRNDISTWKRTIIRVWLGCAVLLACAAASEAQTYYYYPSSGTNAPGVTAAQTTAPTYYYRRGLFGRVRSTYPTQYYQTAVAAQAYQPAATQEAQVAQPAATPVVPVSYTRPATEAAPAEATSPTATTAAPESAPPAVESSDPYGFLSWLNSTRAAYGLPAVGHDPNLSSWAAENNNHQAARGMGHFVMGPARRQNSAFGSFGSIGAMWMNSPAHRAALLDPTIRWMGIAGLGAYWTFNAY
jgi:uncharacterized protein YkwD